jgi:hypothetical protein
VRAGTDRSEENELMADHPPLKLDKAGLQDFVDNQITPFETSLKHLADDDDQSGVTMNSLLGKGTIKTTDKPIFHKQPPLSIGQLRTDKDWGGDQLISKINDLATSVSDVLVKQIKLFGDLHTNLNTTITKLMTGQHDTLEKIDGKLFLDSLGTVPGDFQGTGTTQS